MKREEKPEDRDLEPCPCVDRVGPDYYLCPLCDAEWLPDDE